MLDPPPPSCVRVPWCPSAAKVAGKLMTIRRQILKWTDKRVSIMSEVINGMQVRLACVGVHGGGVPPRTFACVPRIHRRLPAVQLMPQAVKTSPLLLHRLHPHHTHTLKP